MNNYVLKKDSTIKEYKKCLLNWKYNVYFCGNKSDAENYVMRRLLRCDDQKEMQYYNSEIVTGKPTNGRVLTDLICCLYYDDHHIVSAGEIKIIQDVGGQNLLPLCGQFFESNPE